VTGEPCHGTTDCRSGQCVTELNNGVPTGWIGGYCVGNCLLPTGYNPNTFFAGTALPAGSCTGNAICFPVGGTQGDGDLGTCYDACTTPSDCRLGYSCLRQFQLGSGGTATFTNGLCVPVNCTPGACPTGYECVTVTAADGSTRNVCAPSGG